MSGRADVLWRRAATLAVVLGPGLLLAEAAAAQRIESLSQGAAVRRAYAPVVAEANRSVVEILVDDDPRALGTVVAEGLVLTKLSELAPRRDPSAAVDDEPAGGAAGEASGEVPPVGGARPPPPRIVAVQGERRWQCERVGHDRAADVALLRLPGAAPPPITWAEAVPEPGAFLASPDGGPTPVGVGILSAAVYEHTRQRGFLGIRFADLDGDSVEVGEVLQHGAAAAAGLQAGDVIVGFGDDEITVPQELRARLAARSPGDRVQVAVRRGGDRLAFEVVLGAPSSAPANPQARIWGELSAIRSGFRDVLQHDTVLEPVDCGGPLVDLTGRAVGVNIARAGRVETLALPAAAVRALVARLSSR